LNVLEVASARNPQTLTSMDDTKTRLSTSLSIVWKYVFSGLWIMFALICIPLVGLSNAWPVLIGIIFLWFGPVRIKRVLYDDEFLYIDNFIKKEKIPFSDVAHVQDITWSQPRFGSIELHTDSEFGKKIFFMPRFRILIPFQKHNEVTELIEILEEFNSPNPQ